MAGALDYLRDPWQAEELLLRLRGPRPDLVTWTWEGQPFRLEGTILTAGDRRISLSGAEAALIRTLALRQPAPVSRSVLAWAAGCKEGRVVDTLVARIRGKVRDVFGPGPRAIHAVRDVGYRIP
jgi:DNA-binding response OmpR family regulator